MSKYYCENSPGGSWGPQGFPPPHSEKHYARSGSASYQSQWYSKRYTKINMTTGYMLDMMRVDLPIAKVILGTLPHSCTQPPMSSPHWFWGMGAQAQVFLPPRQAVKWATQLGSPRESLEVPVTALRSSSGLAEQSTELNLRHCLAPQHSTASTRSLSCSTAEPNTKSPVIQWTCLYIAVFGEAGSCKNGNLFFNCTGSCVSIYPVSPQR